MTVYCLSVRQPWASLIARGHKDVENRTWATAYRGPLLIHASQTVVLDAHTHGRLTQDEIAALPRGGIVGLVTLTDCVRSHPSQWFTGPIGWLLADALELPFRRCAGQQGLFKIAPQQAALRAVRQRHDLPLFRR